VKNKSTKKYRDVGQLKAHTYWNHIYSWNKIWNHMYEELFGGRQILLTSLNEIEKEYPQMNLNNKSSCGRFIEKFRYLFSCIYYSFHIFKEVWWMRNKEKKRKILQKKIKDLTECGFVTIRKMADIENKRASEFAKAIIK